MGDRIKYFRTEKARYTSAEYFAYDHGIDRSTYWEWEKGYNITWETICRLCRIHRITKKQFTEEGFDLNNKKN